MISVWVLVFYMSNSNWQGGPAMIDNITSQEECVRVQQVFNGMNLVRASRCIEVWKKK